jgi:hypothetical protein
VKHLSVLCLALGALPGFSQNPETPVVPIALYTHFEQEPSEGVVEALHDEIDSIMAPIGMAFEWRSLNGVRGNELSVELAVLTFKGRCDIAGLTSRKATNPGALGWTHVSDGAILPFSDVDCDRIRTFVQKDLLAVRAPDREESFGRAIGRVVAHELYHIFAKTTKHGSCGVGKAAYTSQELLSDDFQFEGKESLALRSSKAHSAVENAMRTSATTPPPAP